MKFLALTCLMLAILALYSAALLSKLGYWLAQPHQVHSADAVAVLGGGFPHRVLRGIQLYDEGIVPEIWRTGNVAWRSEARDAAKLAVEMGVHADAIHLLVTSSTWEDGLEIARLVRESNIRSIIIVTDWSHSRRAMNVIRHHLADSEVEIYYAPALNEPYSPDNWWRYEEGRKRVYSEVGKMAYYWVRYGVATWY